MPNGTKRIFVINTGSTSTKIAIFEDMDMKLRSELAMPLEKLEGKLQAVEQLDDRVEMVETFLQESGAAVEQFDIIVCRGGPLPPCEGGAYIVDDFMVDLLTYAPYSPHESALACMIGSRLAQGTSVPVIIYDGINTDEFMPLARVTGVPEIRTMSRGHVLNTRKIGRQLAQSQGKPFESCRYIIAHFGGSISILAYRDGRIIDMSNAFNGPMSPQRAGRLSSTDLIELCYSGKYTKAELTRKLNGRSGFMAYFGTQDARVVLDRVKQGDETAKLVVEAMAYQCAKGIAEMAVALDGRVDNIIFTGGMARATEFVDRITARVRFIAPVEIIPGEHEMEALAEGGLRVLQGKESPKRLDIPREGYKGFASREDFYAKLGKEEKHRVS